MLNEKNATKPVELIERTKVYDGHVITLYDDHVKIGEHLTHWDFIHHPGAAAVLPVLEDGRLSGSTVTPWAAIPWRSRQAKEIPRMRTSNSAPYR